jgi:hypothetical protein
LKSREAKETKIDLKCIFKESGLPTEIATDAGGEFVGNARDREGQNIGFLALGVIDLSGF